MPSGPSISLPQTRIDWHPGRNSRMGSGSGPVSVALGMFDGVHLGHQSVIRSAREAARAFNGGSAVLTFDPHPSRVLRPEKATQLIFDEKEKYRRLFHCGIDAIFWMTFDQELAALEAVEFIEWLKDGIPGLSSLHVGANFRFGAGRSGDIDSLITLGREAGIDVFSVERFQVNGSPVSSSRIRKALGEAQLDEVNRLLGIPYGLTGVVKPGQGVGKTLGFPTLNLSWNPELPPAFGVYVVRIQLAGESSWRRAVANYGVRPTVVDTSDPVLEVHLLEWDSVFTEGAEVTVEWLSFLRGEKRFPHRDALREQISKDVDSARRVFETRGFPETA